MRQFLFAVLLMLPGPRQAAAVVLDRYVFGAAGGEIHGPETSIHDTLGESVIGVARDDSANVQYGYWYWLSSPLFVAVPPPAPPSLGFRLSQNSPNPCSATTTIGFSIGSTGQSDVSLRVYDIRGRLIRTLVQGKKSPGLYHLVWDGRDDQGGLGAPGVYFYTLRAGRQIQTRKLALLR